MPQPEGRIRYGTCWLVDDEQRLAVTGQHLVMAATEVVVYFPDYRDGKVIPELAHYHRDVAAVHGRVLHCDRRRDLAVLRLGSLPDQVKAMPLAAQSAGPGDTVHSVGNSGVLVGNLWRYTAGKVRSVYDAEILTENGLLQARVLETQSPVNGGDSGGPLVNENGELVGVVNSALKQSLLVSFSVDVSEVRAFLAEVHDPSKAQSSAGARDLASQSPPVQGSWKTTLITLQGDQLPGECSFQANGTFTLTAQAAAGAQTRHGRYSYANGVLLMAWDRFEVRQPVHWVAKRRFTLLSDELLIFDRHADVLAASPPPKGSPSRLGAHSASGPLPTAVEPRKDWALATLLISAVGVLLLLSIKVHGHHNPANSTQPKTVPLTLPPPATAEGEGTGEGGMQQKLRRIHLHSKYQARA